jgi:putative nucleotidyltransferase with HDIG domain
MTRDEAVKLMESKVATLNLRKHTLSVEAVMKALAKRFGEDEELWGMVGILHDLDYDVTKGDPAQHTLVTETWLKEFGVSQVIIDAIKAHNDKKLPQSRLEKAISCVDPTTGFMAACALMHPTKTIWPVDVEFAKNRMKEKRFAKGASRDRMQACTEIGMTLDEFFQLSLDAMKAIHEQIGL